MSQVNNIKVKLIVTIYENDLILDISSATGKTIIVKKPDGTYLNKAATFLTDGSDGKIYYETVEGDLNQAGSYKIQGLILIGGGTYYGSISRFDIKCNL